MAYRSKNLLEDIKWVQDTYLKYKALGYSNRYILQTYINTKDRRCISERTFYEYLTVPANRILKQNFIEN